MQIIKATGLHRKSGGAESRDLQFSPYRSIHVSLVNINKQPQDFLPWKLSTPTSSHPTAWKA
jgi:hypothetical protein